MPCRRSETANNLSFKVPCCSGRLVGADATFRPANYAAETRKSSANPLVPLGGQSRPPLRINCGSNNSQRVGVDAHIDPAVQAVFSEIFGEFAGSQWVDVGIDHLFGTKFFQEVKMTNGSDTLRANLASEPGYLDPALNSSVDGACLAAASFSGLYSYNAEGNLRTSREIFKICGSAGFSAGLLFFSAMIYKASDFGYTKVYP